MNGKRILILDSDSAPKENVEPTIHHVVTCTNTEEALNILMGGSSAFGKDDYAKTGKVRPDVLLMDSSYLDTFEGLELLEIIRKYYSLQNVKIFIRGNNASEIDPAIYRRYRITGHLPQPCQLDKLNEIAFSGTTAEIGSGGGAMLSAGFFGTPGKWSSGLFKLIKGKSVLFSAAKTIVAGKTAAVASCLVLTTALVGLSSMQLDEEQATEQIIQVTDIPPAPATVTVEEIQAVTTPTQVPASQKQKASKKKKVKVKQPEPAAEEKTTAVPVIETPKQQYRIVVVPEEEIETASAE